MAAPPAGGADRGDAHGGALEAGHADGQREHEDLARGGGGGGGGGGRGGGGGGRPRYGLLS